MALTFTLLVATLIALYLGTFTMFHIHLNKAQSTLAVNATGAVSLLGVSSILATVAALTFMIV